MKERMVIKDEQAIDEWNRTIAQFIDVDNKIYKAEFIKVPESWEELKELCKEIGIDAEEDYIELFGVLVGSNILFCNDGAIMLNTDCCFKEKATPQQMWNIIKSLIGEE